LTTHNSPKGSLGLIGEKEAEQWFEAKEAYLALKNNWAQAGRYDDASWAYRKERRMEKATKALWRCRKYFGDQKPFPSSTRRLLGYLSPGIYEGLPRWSPLVWWFWLKYTVKWLADWFVELLRDYGESIGLVLFWMVASLLGFAAYYWRVGGIRLTDPASGSQATATSFWHYLIYSAGAFTTTVFARYQPTCDQVGLVTALQAIEGIFLVALLGFVAGSRIRRS
jgi:hypothetical protein